MKSLLFLITMSLFSCTEPEHARRVVEDSNFKNIEIKGYQAFSCSEDDWFRTGFCAENLNGKKVCGVVCSGLLFKSSTVRID
jgi:hypothetical protein